jgi:hypothetical protein
MKKCVFLFLALFLIIFEAVPEGLALGGHKMIAGMVEAIYLIGVTIGLFAWITGYNFAWWRTTQSFIKILVGYILLRFALFDFVHNISAGLNPFFIGSTKLYDIILSKLGAFVWILKIIGLVWGTSWLMEWWSGIKVKK